MICRHICSLLGNTGCDLERIQGAPWPTHGRHIVSRCKHSSGAAACTRSRLRETGDLLPCRLKPKLFIGLPSDRRRRRHRNAARETWMQMAAQTGQVGNAPFPHCAAVPALQHPVISQIEPVVMLPPSKACIELEQR